MYPNRCRVHTTSQPLIYTIKRAIIFLPILSSVSTSIHPLESWLIHVDLFVAPPTLGSRLWPIHMRDKTRLPTSCSHSHTCHPTSHTPNHPHAYTNISVIVHIIPPCLCSPPLTPRPSCFNRCGVSWRQFGFDFIVQFLYTCRLYCKHALNTCVCVCLCVFACVQQWICTTRFFDTNEVK